MHTPIVWWTQESESIGTGDLHSIIKLTPQFPEIFRGVCSPHIGCRRAQLCRPFQFFTDARLVVCSHVFRKPTPPIFFKVEARYHLLYSRKVRNSRPSLASLPLPRGFLAQAIIHFGLNALPSKHGPEQDANAPNQCGRATSLDAIIVCQSGFTG